MLVPVLFIRSVITGKADLDKLKAFLQKELAFFLLLIGFGGKMEKLQLFLPLSASVL